MQWLTDIAVKAFTALAAFFAIKKYGKMEAEKENLENDVEALKKDAEIDDYYRDMDLVDATKRMREKVHKHNAGNPRT